MFGLVKSKERSVDRKAYISDNIQMTFFQNNYIDEFEIIIKE